ncbi:MAG: LysM peptidoglycan-binding domain-containing protein [Candidatus Rifleibacteriota bacterium]
MIRFNSFRAKDPVLAAIISMGLVFGVPAMTRAQAGPEQGGWEEVGPADALAQQQLMAAPPRVVARPLGQNNYRPPVEPPSQKAAAAPAAPAAQPRPNSSVYVVQAGDTLPKIAMKVYGDPNRWQDLMVLNNIENGNRIFVGQKLLTSSPNSNVSAVNHAPAQINHQQTGRAPAVANHVPVHEVEECPAPSVSADAAEADASFYGQTGGSYTVQRGDTLGKIAKRILGSSKRWRELARANPQVNPNKLNVGETLMIPGAAPISQEMTAPEASMVMAQPLNNGAWNGQMPPAPPANHVPQTHYQMVEPQQMNGGQQTVSAPSFDPPPLMPPPPPVVSNQPYGTPAPQGIDSYAPPAAPPVYSGGSMTPPPPPVQNQYGAPPIGVPDMMTPPPAPYMGAPVPGPAPAPGAPVAISTHELYRDERYRIPDELKPTNFSPYFTNLNGYHGLFETESALLPYISTWNFGLHYRYEKIQYLNGQKNFVEGNESYIPLHLNYAGKKLFVGLTVPFQNWEVKRSGGNSNTVSLSGLHDPSLKVGYQVWKNLEGTHAVTLHAEGKFPGDNYHQPLWDFSGKSNVGVRVGPAEATRGAWVEVGGAYSGVMNDKWTSHLNLALANDSEDSISKYIFRAGMDYRVNQNFSIVGELNSNSYEMDNGTDDTNVDMVVGFVLFNDSWQGSLGFPIALEKDWGFYHDFGVVFGLHHRWD